MFCHFCGKKIKDGASFCPHCGNKVIENRPKTPDEKTNTDAQALAANSPQKRKKKSFLIIPILVLFCLGLFLGYKHFVKVDIQINEANLRYEEAQNCYYLADEFTFFDGNFIGTTVLIDDVKYEISDANNMVISSGTVAQSGDTWTIQQPGLMMGMNTLQITASMKIGNPVIKAVTVVNTSSAYQANASVNTDDSDGDGLIDYYEYIYKTAPNNPDTDGDGLSDYVECVYTETDPTLYSTASDGVCDADRDSDEDGLSNIEEININTDPGSPDSDGDGLNDGDEHSVYSTNPLDDDTDGDGASDSWEIEHNYDPLTYNETFEVVQTSSAIGSPVSASVTLVCDGNPDGLHIEPTNIDGLLDETIVGYLGSAYSFTYGGEFASAIITMTFDSERLADNAEPTIYYYNEDTQLLEELNTTIEGNTASTTVSHFSTYVLLDRTQVSRIIEEDIVSPQDVEDTIVNIAFVVDYSSSMNDNDPEYMRLKIVKEYLTKLREDKDSATLVQFAGYATTLVPLTSDKEMLINATNSISNTGSDSCSYDDAGTNGSDGLRHALDQLATSETATYQYIIFLTDGEDTTSSYSYDDLISEAANKNIIIYTVGMGDCDEELLSKIATSTGGKFHYASTVDYDTDGTLSLKDVFEEIEKETVDYYADSNNDGISDYYTRLICEGLLTTGTGANPFGNLSYDEIQSKDVDYDGDGLANGEEIYITQSGDMIYMKYNSSPVLSDTDHDGHTDDQDERRLLWDVGDRDLAIFAALTYEDGSSFIGKMYNASQVQGSEDEKGETYYFLNYASIDEGGIDEAISDNWVIVDYVNKLSTIDFFSATTFKCQDNIVISYRGTSELGEWIDNIVCYGLCNYHTEEIHARQYAQKIAVAFPNCNIYITGHSLGGYLAQIGTAELLENTQITPNRSAYFNGIGMNFQDHSGVTELLKNDLMEIASDINKYFHLTDMAHLSQYAKSGNLISYEISGDVVSALGTHCGQEIAFDASMACRKHHAGKYGESNFSVWLGNVLTGFLSDITAKNISSYYSQYNTKSIMEYFWVTHETDSFFYNLDQGTRSAAK